MAVKTNYQKNGSAYFRVTATIGKSPDGKPIRKEFYGKSKKEAEQKRDDYLHDIRLGLASDYRSHTLGEAMDLWLFNVVKPTKAENTLVRYLNVYDHYIKPSELYGCKVSSISNMDIQRIYNRFSEEGKTLSMLQNTNKVLKVFFNYCIKQRYIIINPCVGIEFPKQKAPVTAAKHDKVDPFTDAEIKIILDNAPDYMYPLLTTAFATGLREGELLALNLSDVNFDKGTIHVNKALKATYDCTSLTERKRVVKIGETKTEGSVRDVPIPKNIIPMLRQQIAHQYMLFSKYNTPPGEQLLFTTPTGTYIDAHNLQRRWARLLKKIGVRYRKFHNIRHPYVKLKLKNIFLSNLASVPQIPLLSTLP